MDLCHSCRNIDERSNCVCVCRMDSVPLKVPQVVSHEVRQHVEVNVPDYLAILQETEVSVV